MADPYSIARCISSGCPPVVEDARRATAIVRVLAASGDATEQDASHDGPVPEPTGAVPSAT